MNESDAGMPRRISFFVESCEHGSGWAHVRGQVGLGPVAEGDVFTFVHHQHDGTEDKCHLAVVEVSETDLRLSSGEGVALRPGDILGGEAS